MGNEFIQHKASSLHFEFMQNLQKICMDPQPHRSFNSELVNLFIPACPLMFLLKCKDLQMCTSPEFLQRWCGDDSSCDLEDCGKSLDPWSLDGTASPDPELSASGFKYEKKKPNL